MSASCCNHTDDQLRGHEGYRRVLWAVLGINAAMFVGRIECNRRGGNSALMGHSLGCLFRRPQFANDIVIGAKSR